MPTTYLYISLTAHQQMDPRHLSPIHLILLDQLSNLMRGSASILALVPLSLKNQVAPYAMFLLFLEGQLGEQEEKGFVGEVEAIAAVAKVVGELGKMAVVEVGFLGPDEL
ncbi:hypothetical protein AMTR_s00009p00104890 [Amborella trichopoda]|uniref:Uncharacterized protein n=1 Tax=Amborella trichopoda TaxID=13333 RepID=W1NH93_AMBTC|nr:hypothetical protein AMTR_s00009p00104890 [Amborella trichopoda]